MPGPHVALPASGRAPARRWRAAIAVTAFAGLAAVPAPPAHAANETVNIWLTTTSDSGGRTVTRGLQQQGAIAFSPSSAAASQTITVNENNAYQSFLGAGASFTDTAAYLLGSSNALSATTRNQVMANLFSPTSGIGLGFLRNPMGASDLARYSYTFDDVPAGQTDPSLARFSIAHDLVDVLPLTKQAEQLNPSLKVLASPWTAPPWMKDNGSYNQGWLQSQYYGAYAQYFVKYLQAYAAQGVHVDYVTAQNEPTCCAGYPSMNWNGSGLQYFTGTSLLPALHNAGLSTKVLALDWNWDAYDSYAAPTVNDASIRNDSLFGGVAWHGYSGNVAQQTTVHNTYPTLDAFDTEHSGGTWIANQQKEDMENIIDYTRNWGRTVTKWSLAVDQNMGPHNGGCSTCTGLITVHNGDSRSGQVDYTVEYYDTGQLTKFVKPGARRIDSTDNATIRNVAWKNPDGSKALVAYNESTSAQSVKVQWGNESFTYTVPGSTAATFTWSGAQGSGSTVVSFRAHANGQYVTAENAGASALIANRTAIGGWEIFDKVVNADGTISLRAHANNNFVRAENAGSSPLIADSPTIGGSWEAFDLVTNADGSVSLRSRANNLYVTAENAGASALIANRSAIGGWEEFDLIYD
jgi:glucosylceramidase